jgi:hypothetical protein
MLYSSKRYLSTLYIQVVWIAIMGNADWKPLQFLCFAFFYRILQKLRATEPAITPIYNVRLFQMLHVCHLTSLQFVQFLWLSSDDVAINHFLLIQVFSSRYGWFYWRRNNIIHIAWRCVSRISFSYVLSLWWWASPNIKLIWTQFIIFLLVTNYVPY